MSETPRTAGYTRRRFLVAASDLSATLRNYRTGGTPWMILINPRGFVVFNDFRVNSDRLIEVLNDATAVTG